MSEDKSRFIPYDEFAVGFYKDNPQMSMELLQDCLRDGEIDEFLGHLKIVTKAFGSVAELAEKTGLNEKTLHKTLSTKGNPTLKTLHNVLDCLGFTLSIEPKQTVA